MCVSTGPTNGNAMNWSMYTADCTTHLKIVVVGLVAALLIVAIGISGRDLNLGTDIMTTRAPTVIKAGAPIALTDRSGPVIR
jgi:ABC-type Fe3+ transport system permease subunit